MRSIESDLSMCTCHTRDSVARGAHCMKCRPGAAVSMLTRAATTFTLCGAFLAQIPDACISLGPPTSCALGRRGGRCENLASTSDPVEERTQRRTMVCRRRRCQRASAASGRWFTICWRLKLFKLSPHMSLHEVMEPSALRTPLRFLTSNPRLRSVRQAKSCETTINIST